MRIYIPKETVFLIFSKNMFNFYNLTCKASETLIDMLHVVNLGITVAITVSSKYNFIVCDMDTCMLLPNP
jgi:hypothetical protein